MTAGNVADRKPDLVLLHGWALHSGVFAPLIDALRDRFTLHALDLPGHGRRVAEPVPGTQASWADTVLASAPANALWLGWSLGGLVALEAALRSPARLRGLMVMASSPRFVRGNDWPFGMDAEVLAGFARQLQTQHAQTVQGFIALDLMHSPGGTLAADALRRDILSQPAPSEAAIATGATLLAQSDLRSRLAYLTMPSCWVASERDRLAAPGAIQAAAALAPKAEFQLIPRAGHAPFLGDTAAIATAVDNFHATLP